jgi:hypothetical protein
MEINKRLKCAKKEIIKILSKFDCELRPIDLHTVGLVSQDYVVNQEIEKWIEIDE